MSQHDDSLDPDILDALEILKPTPARDPEAAARGRARFLAEARPLEKPARISPWIRLRHRLNANHRPKRRAVLGWQLSGMLTGLLIALVLLLTMGGSALSVYAAENALPGDPLYGLKNVTEDARVTLTGDAVKVAELHLEFARRRLDEISALIEQQRYDDIRIATEAFESHIFRAIGALGTIANRDPSRSEAVSNQIIATLSRYSEILAALLEAVPSGVPQTALEEAVQASRLTVTPTEVEFEGQVSAISATTWTVNGLAVQIAPQTEIAGSIQVGTPVKVHAWVDAKGVLTAREIQPHQEEKEEGAEIELTGTVKSLSSGSMLIGGQQVAISGFTEIKDSLQEGDVVKVKAILAPDGSLTAVEIEVVDRAGDHPTPATETIEDNHEDQEEGSRPEDIPGHEADEDEDDHEADGDHEGEDGGNDESNENGDDGSGDGGEDEDDGHDNDDDRTDDDGDRAKDDDDKSGKGGGDDNEND